MMSSASSLTLGEGERLQRSRTRRHVAVKSALFAVGLATGAYIGFKLASTGFDLSAPWSRSVAVALALLYVVAIAAGSLLLNKSIDELERDRTYKAVAVAGSAYMIVYPVWFMLWKGGLAVEPIHWLLFAGFWLLMIGAAIYYRFR